MSSKIKSKSLNKFQPSIVTILPFLHNKQISNFKYIIFILLLSIMTLQAQVNPVSPAQGFSTFIEGDATLKASETESNIAIGGNLNLNSGTAYQISTITAGSVFFGSDTKPTSLLINGTINFNGGNLVQVNQNGWVKVGNCSGVTVYDVDNNSVPTNTQVTSGAFNSMPRIQLNSRQPANTVCQSNLIDFNAAFATIRSYSAGLAACTENLYFVDANENPLPNPNNPPATTKVLLASNTINIINTTPDALDNILDLIFQNLSANSPIIFNVDGGGNNFTWNVPNFAGTNPNYIFWNFINIPNLTFIGGNTVDGTVYAPNTHLFKNNSGNIQGSIIVQTLTHLSGEIHEYPWTLNLPLCTPICNGTDTDNDGVPDMCDNDDDNDGILDENEGCIGIIPPPIPGTVLGGDLLLDSVNFSAASGAIVAISTVTNYVAMQNPIGAIEPSGQTFISGYDAFSGLGSVIMNFNNPSTFQIIDEFIVRIQYYNSIANIRNTSVYVSNPKITLQTDVGNFTLIDTLTYSDKVTLSNQNWIPIEFRVPINANQVTINAITLQLESMNGGIGAVFDPASREVFGFGIDFIGSDIYCRDTDNDGIADAIDLDSDGDGCFDVIESGGTDANNDGKLDGTSFDSNGLVTGGTGGYNGTNGNEYQATQLTVTTDPNNQTVKGGNAVSFNVGVTADNTTSYNNGTPIYSTSGSANTGLQYQWYLGNPNTGGTILTNNAIFGGTNTATLTINNTENMNGNEFCVLVTHQNNVCINEIRCATLTLTENCSNSIDDDGDGLIDCADPDCILPAPQAIIMD